jgi:Ca-activated chloride channel homolog
MNAVATGSGNLWLPALICGLLLAFSPAQDTPSATAKQNSLAAVPAPGANKEQDEEFTIHSNVDRVLLDVSVKDAKGGFVRGLDRAAFRVIENGKPQEITEFTSGDIPVTVGILLDQSGSMRSKQSEVLTAALSFAKESNPSDEMFVVRFNEKAELALPPDVPFTDSMNTLRTVLLSATPQGRTALYDAVVLGLEHLQLGRQAKKTLVLISDGGDNDSKHRLSEVMRLTEQTSATIYTVGVFDPDDPDSNPGLLRKLAQISGGIAYFPAKLDDVVPVCEGIAKDIRNRYSLAYIPQSGPQGIRHVSVQVHAAGHDRLIARTRTSYLYTSGAEAMK